MTWEQRLEPQQVAQNVLPAWHITLGVGGRCRQDLRDGLERSWPGLCFPQMLAPAKQQRPVAPEA